VRRDECTDYGGTYKSHSTKEQPSFKLYCGQDYNEDNMVQEWTSTFAQCMDLCAGYNTGHIATCLGVSFDASSKTGLSKCFLKAANNLEKLSKPDHLVFSAFLIQSNPGPQTVTTTAPGSMSTSQPSRTSETQGPTATPSPAPEASGGESKAWIAGAVIGPLAALALIGALAWWWKRRRDERMRANRPRWSDQPMEERRG
jgi:hypothetical protein